MPNKSFLLNELKDALNKSNQTPADPDGIIYYQFLTHIPEDCLKILLQIFKAIWLSGKIPSSWKEAIVADSSHKLSLQEHGTNGQWTIGFGSWV